LVKDTTTSLKSDTICNNQLPYRWNGNNYSFSGTYIFRTTNAAGCDSVARLNLVVKDTTVSFNTIRICSNQIPYPWNNRLLTSPGLYTSLLTNAAGCDSLATLRLLVDDTTTIFFNKSICQNLLPFNWDGTAYTTAGTYVKNFLNVAGCDSIVTLNLRVLATSATTVTRDICFDQLPYLWNGNSYNTAGIYNTLLTNAAGCDSAVTLFLSVNPLPQKPALGSDTLICPGDKLILNPGSYDNYLWQNSSTFSTFEVTEAGNYSVVVGNSTGCKNSDNITVRLLSNCDDIYFPNAFSPNGDRYNDDFGAMGNLFLVKNYSLFVFNRFGKIIFTTNNPYHKWDGLTNGTTAPLGTYIWKAKYDYRGMRNKVRSGNLVLLK
jgi:gliding motility-associated-like protein